MPPPRWGTRRRPERETLGPAVALVAEKLGTPLFPAQRYLLDTALEINPETGLLAYSTIVATLHRQFGKTMCLILPTVVMRATLFSGQAMVYTAQDRNHAREKFEEDFVEQLRGATSFREGRDYKIRLANGSERIRFKSRSLLKISATQNSSGHGKTLDMPVVDEAWTHEDTTVDSGFRVPMITRRGLGIAPGPQLWIVSAAGESDHSEYFTEKCARGREAVERDSGSGTAYFEWSCPKDWDIYDRSLWWFYIPALGHTIQERDIADELDDMKEPDWRRAYGNQPQPRDDEDDADGMDLDAWSRQVDGQSEIEGTVMLAVDGSPDRRWAALAAVGERPDGDLHGDLVDTRAGMGWLATKTIEVARRQGCTDVAVDPTSSAGSIISELEAAGLSVHKLGSRAHAHAAGALYDRVVDGEFWHRGNRDLQAAVVASRKRPLGDAWAWDRRNEEDNLTPLVAVTLGVGAFLAAAEGPQEPSVYDELGGFRDW